jgi:hypothetical protein
MVKRFVHLPVVAVLFVFGANFSDVNGAEAAAAPAEVIRSFYKWYITALESGGDPLAQKRSELQKFVTTRLLKQIDRTRKGPDGLEADPFLEAQDFDKEWASKISVRSTQIDKDRATCEVLLSGHEVGSRKLRVTLAQEQGSWKVDKVVGLD